MSSHDSTLDRSDDRVIAGVIGGLAEYFGLESTLLRLATVFFVVATGLLPGIAAYTAGVILMPAPHAQTSRSTVETAVSAPSRGPHSE
jgi:phage shock protein PspC (stress-responsive transcriptional regulator)